MSEVSTGGGYETLKGDNIEEHPPTEDGVHVISEERGPGPLNSDISLPDGCAHATWKSEKDGKIKEGTIRKK